MGYGKAERLGGLAVQDHLEFHRKLHREIARLPSRLGVDDCQPIPLPDIGELTKRRQRVSQGVLGIDHFGTVLRIERRNTMLAWRSLLGRCCGLSRWLSHPKLQM